MTQPDLSLLTADERPTESDLARFWAKVQKAGDQECWTWTAMTISKRPGKNYGFFHYKGRMVVARRFVWMITNGSIPAGMFVCHHCDNPICVNPHHRIQE